MPRNTCIYSNKPKTFRRSARKMIGGQGSNLQNIEKELRGIYIPDGFSEAMLGKCKFFLQTGDFSLFTEEELLKIRIFLQVDQSGAEALIVAYDCEPGDYRQLFIHNVKPHVYVALKLFKDIWTRKLKESGALIEDFDIDVIDKTPIHLLKTNPFWKDLDRIIKASDGWSLTERYYYFAKQTVHSANYDIQVNTFQLNVLEKSGGKIMIPKDEAQRFLDVYRNLFPEIPARNKRVERQVEEFGILYNLHGHPYIITDYNVMSSSMKDLYAWGPQSTVGEITRIAFTNLQEYIEDTKKKWDILADTHDSYLVQCPLMDVKECSAKMSEMMDQKLKSPVDSVEFNMRSEVNIGMNWGPHKKDINELGLQEIKW